MSRTRCSCAPMLTRLHHPTCTTYIPDLVRAHGSNNVVHNIRAVELKDGDVGNAGQEALAEVPVMDSVKQDR
jgi:hypothetical protein